MKKFAQILSVTLLMLMPLMALAGPAEDANAVVDRWSASYNANDPEAVVKNYWPDAILLGRSGPPQAQARASQEDRQQAVVFMACTWSR
jgi:hypothetical protein